MRPPRRSLAVIGPSQNATPDAKLPPRFASPEHPHWPRRHGRAGSLSRSSAPPWRLGPPARRGVRWSGGSQDADAAQDRADGRRPPGSYLFLASDRARGITGTIVSVDGAGIAQPRARPPHHRPPRPRAQRPTQPCARPDPRPAPDRAKAPARPRAQRHGEHSLRLPVISQPGLPDLRSTNPWGVTEAGCFGTTHIRKTGNPGVKVGRSWSRVTGRGR